MTMKDDELLEELFEDFHWEKVQDTTNHQVIKDKENTVKNKIIFFIILLLAMISGYLVYIYSFWGVNTSQHIATGEHPSQVAQNINSSDKVDESTYIDKSYEENLDDKNEFSDFFQDESWNTNDASKFSSTWWEQNIELLSSKAIKLHYPEGSFKPSWDIQWWAGFIYDIGEKRESLSLVYDIELDKNFQFVKWWKLAGLCGGDCPRWADNNSNGFSTIFSWKKDGFLDMNVIFPWADTYWENLPRKVFQLEAWKKYTLKQTITLNTPWKADWVLTLYVNDKVVYVKTNYVFRNSVDVKIDALIFSSFFWGSDSSWATPVDTYITFSDFKLIR